LVSEGHDNPGAEGVELSAEGVEWGEVWDWGADWGSVVSSPTC